jgi:hypothetical protein
LRIGIVLRVADLKRSAKKTVRKPLKHVFVSVLSLVGGYAASLFLGLVVWFIVGDNPESDNPVLAAYQVLYWVIPLIALIYFNLRLHRKKGPNQPLQRNADDCLVADRHCPPRG